jgi:phenylpropionate dioxygenase-like ring-hydroxylating dioxygenase large terminal subunit
MKICRYEQGNTSTFTCPYHSWSHTTDGKLQSLIEVAKLMNYKGTIWATWDPEAPDFLAYLGDAKDHLDQVVDCRDRREGGYEVIGVHKWVFSANWKFAAENFLGDTYTIRAIVPLTWPASVRARRPEREGAATMNSKRHSTFG